MFAVWIRMLTGSYTPAPSSSDGDDDGKLSWIAASSLSTRYFYCQWPTHHYVSRMQVMHQTAGHLLPRFQSESKPVPKSSSSSPLAASRSREKPIAAEFVFHPISFPALWRTVQKVHASACWWILTRMDWSLVNFLCLCSDTQDFLKCIFWKYVQCYIKGYIWMWVIHNAAWSNQYLVAKSMVWACN